jgi:hypothetical protein
MKPCLWINLRQNIDWLVPVWAIFLALQPWAVAADAVDGITAVSSKVTKDYVRTKLSDGSFQPELYAFGKGGKWSGEVSDSTIDTLNFVDIAKVIAVPLAAQRYLPAGDPGKTKLLIMVYWGTTAVPGTTSASSAYNHFGSAQVTLQFDLNPLNKVPVAIQNAAISDFSAATLMLNIENRKNDRTDFANALMLGYDSPGLIGTEKADYVRGTAFQTDRDDLYREIEENRYFVVLMAYDFQLLWKERKHKLLWETRFSISERRNQFDKALPVMARYASQYFGQASDGLVRTRVPEGNVDVKEPTLIEFLPEPKK